MSKTLPALAALAVATTLVVPTVSQAMEVPSVRVSYADLNLTTSLDQNRLERRIAFAANVVCGTSDPRDLNYVRAVGECRTETVADAQPQLRAAIGRALHPSVKVLDTAALIITAR